MPEVIQLDQRWIKGKEIGSGGFGRVFEAKGERDELAALKFVKKEPGADRELLVAAEIKDCPHVLPVLDHGEHDGNWVLAMPRAERSLTDVLESAPDGLPINDALKVLREVAAGLEGIEDKIVHRDLKPSNILFWNGAWHISDFGIARYADVATATVSWKDARTSAYAAPEQWKGESPTSRLDVYAFGTIAYEVLTGRRLFTGPSSEDYRKQHLTQESFDFEGIPNRLQTLLGQCLKKRANERPSATEIASFLRVPIEPQTDIARRLGTHDAAESQRQFAESARAESERQRQEKRADWYASAHGQMRGISDLLETRTREFLSTAEIEAPDGVLIRMGDYEIRLAPVHDTRDLNWGTFKVPFDVIAATSIQLCQSNKSTRQYHGRGFRYIGRSHSLWFCDATTEGDYRWYELAFQRVGIIVRDGPWIIPMAVAPGQDVATAFSESPYGGFRLARPLKRLGFDRHEEFISEWLERLADALDGNLREPNLPEGKTAGSFRRS